MGNSEGIEYLKEMASSRGYLFDLHKVLAAEDLEFLKKYNEMSAVCYTDDRLLDKRTKELLFTAVLTACNATHEHIKTHIRLALQAGATKEELLQVMELCFMPCGATAFLHGFEAWKEVCDPKRLEPKLEERD